MDAHLDEKVGPAYQAAPLAQDWARVAKVSEELGEAIDALILMTGQNPRKRDAGVTAGLDDLLEELADTACTAIFAMQHFTKDGEATVNRLDAKLRTIHRRMVGQYGR